MGRLVHDRITEEDLADVGEFLKGRNLGDDSSGGLVSSEADVQALMSILRWRLVDNPAIDRRIASGFCIRENGERIAGVLLCLPARFALHERSLIGLCGCGFFVEPQFRLQGFLLFRRFLSESPVDFRFATTCNAASAAMWEKLGGKPVAGSQQEHFFPIRFEPLAEELCLRRNLGSMITTLGRAAGKLATPVLRSRPTSGSVRLQPCREWDRLARLAARHRDAKAMTARRSTADLEWRYDRTPARAANEVFLFQDAQGHEGWVSLGEYRRGRKKQIRAWMILDMVYPRRDFDLSRLFAAVLQRFADRADMIAVRGPQAVGRAAVEAGARCRTFNDPLAYVLGSSAADRDLAQAAELFSADGDTAP